MALETLTNKSLGWRWIAVALLFALGLASFSAGVTLSERPFTENDGIAVQIYYILGLFVVGGLDLGIPTGGPIWARALLWITYFGAPLITASAVIEAVIRVINPQQWLLRNLNNHVVIFGSGDLTLSYLRILRNHSANARVIVVDNYFTSIREQELQQRYGVITVVGDLTLGFSLKKLNLPQARRVLLLGDDDYQAFEAATRVLEAAPNLKFKVIVHCQNLRFMRSLLRTSLGRHCVIFNTYNLAALGFVRTNLIEHFRRTHNRDNVVIAGFGRFGQSVLEQLEKTSGRELSHVALIDQDAERRIQVVEEQHKLGKDYQRSIFRGDISHPEVWRNVSRTIDLSLENTVVILGTGNERDNLRTALWIKQQYSNALVYTRSNNISKFAMSVADEKELHAFSINQLVEDMIPTRWTR
jgi:Trk K+ transport system NAD-binding subunit